jgi:hypothetical protein
LADLFGAGLASALRLVGWPFAGVLALSSSESGNEKRWLDLLRESGDADLGSGLSRLAKLAAAAHQREVARQQEVRWVSGREAEERRA